MCRLEVVPHKKFWGAKRNMNASQGWITIPLIRACIVAFISRNYKISVDSAYLQLWLVKRTRS